MNLRASPPQQNPAVCLLDDDPSAIRATSRLLESAGWAVTSFTDPLAFLEHARAHPPPVVVLDLRMPVMNGLQVQTHLRSISPTTRVVVLTSNDDPAVRAQALDAGASAFFLKLVDNQEFLAGVQNAVARS